MVRSRPPSQRTGSDPSGDYGIECILLGPKLVASRIRRGNGGASLTLNFGIEQIDNLLPDLQQVLAPRSEVLFRPIFPDLRMLVWQSSVGGRKLDQGRMRQPPIFDLSKIPTET